MYRQIVAEVEAAQGRVKATAKALKYYEVVAALESEEDRARVRGEFLQVLTPLEREAEISGGRVTVGALVEWGRDGRGLFEPEAEGDAEGRRGIYCLEMTKELLRSMLQISLRPNTIAKSSPVRGLFDLLVSQLQYSLAFMRHS